MKKLTFILLSILFTSTLLGCNPQPTNTEEDPQVIGGERDEHGCLGPAGYTWSEEAQACLREWEIEMDGGKAAIKIAVEYLGWQGDATVIEVLQARCPGCYTVKLENNSTQDRKNVTLDNWEVKSTSLTPKECQERGGEPMSTVGGASCPEGQENIGEVTGFISPNICCAATK